MKLRDVILRVVNSSGLIKTPVRTGTVSEIDTNNFTCKVTLSTGAPVFNVQLQAITGNGNSGVIVIPTDGSNVLVSMIEGLDAQWHIINTSNIDSFSVFSAGGKIEVLKNGEVHINGKKVNGQDSPLPEINGLKTRMNALENIVTNHQHVAPTGGGPTTSNGSQTATQTQLADIQNLKVYQGDGT